MIVYRPVDFVNRVFSFIIKCGILLRVKIIRYFCGPINMLVMTNVFYRLVVRTFFILLFSFGFITATNAQFTDSTTRYINFGSTGVINKTNDGDSYVLNNSLRFNIRRKDISLNAGAGWVYGQQNGNLTNNDFTSSLDFNLFKGIPGFYYWGLATYEKSRSLKINDRSQVGFGVAYNIVENEKLFLNLSEGLLLERSDVFLNDTTREVKTITRNSFRFRYRWTIKKLVTLEGTQFLQNAFGDSDDYIIKSVNSLNLKLTSWLNFTTALTYNRVNQTQRENLLLTFGISMEKYF